MIALSVCGIPNPFTTKVSPVLVLGIKLISDGLALMSAANSAFISTFLSRFGSS